MRLILILVFLVTGLAGAQNPPNFDQHPGAPLPAQLRLIDENGQTINLRELVQGQPSVLVMGYFGCPMLCNQVQSGLLDSLKTVSGQHQVVSVSIDPRERPELARRKRQAALSRGADWRYLTGTPEEIGRLCDTVGFQFRYDRKSEQFAHPAGLIFMSADGRVASYLFGISFSGPALQRALDRAAQNQIDGKVDPVLYLCFQYDPATGRYSLQIWRTLQLLGIGTSLLLFSTILYWLHQERKA